MQSQEKGRARSRRVGILMALTLLASCSTYHGLLGSRSALHRVWKAWDVGIQTKNGYTAGHSSIIYGITGTGRMAVVYPSNFSPAQIVHDVPLLAGS